MNISHRMATPSVSGGFVDPAILFSQADPRFVSWHAYSRPSLASASSPQSRPSSGLPDIQIPRLHLGPPHPSPRVAQVSSIPFTAGLLFQFGVHGTTHVKHIHPRSPVLLDRSEPRKRHFLGEAWAVVRNKHRNKQMTHIYSRKPHRQWFSAPPAYNPEEPFGLIIYLVHIPIFHSVVGAAKWAKMDARLYQSSDIFYPEPPHTCSRKYFRRRNGMIWWETSNPGNMSKKINQLRYLGGSNCPTQQATESPSVAQRCGGPKK